MRGVPRDAQVLRLDRVVERRLHALRDDVRATCGPYCWSSIRSGALPGRKPATSTVRARRVSQLLNFAFDVGDRHRDVQTALQSPERFECCLHCETKSWLKRGARFPVGAGLVRKGDSNPHGLPRQLLRLVRLPIPPLSRLRRGTLASRPACTSLRHRMTRERACGASRPHDAAGNSCRIG